MFGPRFHQTFEVDYTHMKHMKHMKTLGLVTTLLLMAACSTEPASNDTNETETTSQDITEAIFTETSADCEEYINEYFSTVKDIKRNVGFEGTVSVEKGSSGCTILVNGIPNHNFNDATASFATDVAEVTRSFTLKQNPTKASTPTELSQGYFDAIMLNGVVLDMLSAGCYRPTSPQANPQGIVAVGCTPSDPWLVDPLGIDSKFGADAHNAHTQPDGTYHYHGSPMAMFNDSPGSEGSPVIGFAADGFPIFGSYFKDPATGNVRKAVSGYTLKQDNRPGPDNTNPGGSYTGLYIDDYAFTGAGDLDECNGMTVNGQYGYYVTEGYPWVLKCLSGTPHSSFRKTTNKAKQDPSYWHHEH